MQALVRTPEIKKALKEFESGASFVFLTGRAGTGKSTLLKEFRKSTKKTCVYLAPTGVAALNIGGETIHSFFGFAPGITVANARKKGREARDQMVYSTVELLVIDEISMVRADLMDCVDAFLRGARGVRDTFGGLRVAGIGDLSQLPPVISHNEREEFSRAYGTPFFFGSDAYKKLDEQGEISRIELSKIFRQQDPDFISILNAIRDGSATSKHFAKLSQRVSEIPHEDAIRLTGTNAAADEVNRRCLASLSGREYGFEGTIKGDVKDSDMPTTSFITLKQHARVMFTANDPMEKFVNGTMGTVTDIGNNGVFVKIDGGNLISVTPHTWSLFRTTFNTNTKLLDQEKIGSFTQLPIRLAWAVTIHKSQGKTFDRVHIDLRGGAFASGQTYVALSRARSLEGITLAAPLSRHHLILDPDVKAFIADKNKISSAKKQKLEI